MEDSNKGLASPPIQRKEPQALTGTELNAAVYRYLLESGFVHTAFNFFYEAGIGRDNIVGMIPQGALIRVVHKGLQFIELEANSELGSDDEHHFFDTLDLMTNDLDELRKKIASSEKCNSVKNDKEKKIDSEKARCSAETDKAQCSAETSTIYRKKPMQKTKALQNSNPDNSAMIPGIQPMKHVKAQGMDSLEQNISSAEIAQKTGSAETTAIYRKMPIRKRKAEWNRNPDETAAIHRTQPMEHVTAQGIDSKEQNISSAEVAQKTGSVETTAIYRKMPIRKRKAEWNRNPDETAAIHRTQPLEHVTAQGIDSKEQNISSAETAQMIGSASAETTALYQRKPMRTMKVAQNSNLHETATIHRQPTKRAKAQGIDSKEQNISSAETLEKTGSGETTTVQGWQLSWIGKKPRSRK